MDAEYEAVACLLFGLAIVVNLFRRLPPKSKRRQPRWSAGPRAWVTRDLFRGDLRALDGVVTPISDSPGRDQIARLAARGFLKESNRGVSQATLKGRFALLLRATIARDKQPSEAIGLQKNRATARRPRAPS